MLRHVDLSETTANKKKLLEHLKTKKKSKKKKYKNLETKTIHIGSLGS